jgi:hypothetical protein
MHGVAVDDSTNGSGNATTRIGCDAGGARNENDTECRYE